MQHDITKFKSNVFGFVGRVIPFEEWVPEADSIAFPFQEDITESPQETESVQKAHEDDDNAVENEVDEYEWNTVGEAPSETERRTHLRKQKENHAEEKTEERPYRLSRGEEKASRADRAKAREHRFSCLMALHTTLLDTHSADEGFTGFKSSVPKSLLGMDT